jgi:hypothetical protein
LTRSHSPSRGRSARTDGIGCTVSAGTSRRIRSTLAASNGLSDPSVAAVNGSSYPWVAAVTAHLILGSRQ